MMNNHIIGRPLLMLLPAQPSIITDPRLASRAAVVGSHVSWDADASKLAGNESLRRIVPPGTEQAR